MAKKKIFDELVERTFRWPQAGDTPFTDPNSAESGVNLEENSRRRNYLITEGYKKSADLMIQASLKQEADRDYLIYPIIFSYRQFIELSLKNLIGNYGTQVGVDSIWNTHNLSKLWQEFYKVLEGYGTDDPDDADPVVKDAIAKFSTIDPASFNFRYHVNTKGEPISLDLEEIDLTNLLDVMNAVSGYFVGCDGYLDSLASSGP